jgi:hypothetical protein
MRICHFDLYDYFDDLFTHSICRKIRREGLFVGLKVGR